MSTPNYHEQLTTLISELDRGQDTTPFNESTIGVNSDHIVFWWEDADELLLDVASLAATAAKLEMKAFVLPIGDCLAVQLWPLEKAGGAA